MKVTQEELANKIHYKTVMGSKPKYILMDSETFKDFTRTARPKERITYKTLKQLLAENPRLLRFTTNEGSFDILEVKNRTEFLDIV